MKGFCISIIYEQLKNGTKGTWQTCRPGLKDRQTHTTHLLAVYTASTAPSHLKGSVTSLICHHDQVVQAEGSHAHLWRDRC